MLKLPEQNLKLRLRALRARHDLTQKEMAEHLGISATSYSSKERELSEFTRREIEGLMDAFQCSYRDIFRDFKGSRKVFPQKSKAAPAV